MSQELDYDRMNRDLDITKSQVFRKPDAAFFGPLLCALDFRWDERVETAATNGKELAWAPTDFLRCKAEGNREDESTLMHELWHNARLHDIRRGGRCPDVWNIACDIWINRELKKAGYYIGLDWVLRPEFDSIELEEDIYDLLKKQGGGGSSGGTVPSSGQSGHCHHQDAGGIMAPVTKAQAIQAVVKAIQSAKMAGQPGSIPGNMESIIDRFLSPIIPWEQHLYKWMQDLANDEYTWARPDRRHMHDSLYLPSRYQDDGRLSHLLYVQDVSGSVTDAGVLRFNSELKYVWDTFQPQKMTIAQFDTRITQIDEYKEGDPYAKIKITGRGGTDLRPVHELIMKLKPTAAIIFSDMHVAPMERLPEEIPVLWVAVDDGWGIGHIPTFGKTIIIKGTKVHRVDELVSYHGASPQG